MGYSRKNPHPPDGWDSGNSRGRGGQILWKSKREGGLNLKKSSAGVILTDNSRDSNVKFSDSSSLSDPENSTNILFRYFSCDKNDNLSSFAGPFIAENTNIKILKNEQRCYVATKSLKRLTHFYSYPDPARHCCVISRFRPVEILFVWCKL